jgi:hypothetical protein
MRALALIMTLTALLVSGCAGPPPESAPGPVLTDVPTSPAGFSDQHPAGPLATIVRWGRQFRGNPIPLGLVTGAVLLGALGLGIFTLYLVSHEHPPRSSDS